MLTRADEYPIHQTPEPIAYTGSRDFYDRYFFNGYQPDLSLFFGVAFAVYPQLNLADAHFSVLSDGIQHSLHASRVLHMERMDLGVGPVRLEILEPLHRIGVSVSGDGLSAELVCEGRAFPIEEPRFLRRSGPRTRYDYTRMTQNVRWSGWIEIDGRRHQLHSGALGTRDRSWGVRPLGSSDPQPILPKEPLQFFWMWTPTHFEDHSVFFVVNSDTSGKPWATSAVLTYDRTGADAAIEAERATGNIRFCPGTRHPRSATVELAFPGQPQMRLTFEPTMLFSMRGLGYGHDKWGHGRFLGPMEIERETIRLAEMDPGDPRQVHVQGPSHVILERDDGSSQKGVGTLETIVLGPYEPYGLTGLTEPHSEDTTPQTG